MLSDRRQFSKPRNRITKAGTVPYSACQHDGTDCPMKPQCCPNMPNRRIMRSVHESSRDVARALAATPEYAQSQRDRKKIEMLCAHLKRILKLDRLRLRGLSAARDEFLLAASAQNLRRRAKRLIGGPQQGQLMPAGRRPGGPRPSSPSTLPTQARRRRLQRGLQPWPDFESFNRIGHQRVFAAGRLPRGRQHTSRSRDWEHRPICPAGQQIVGEQADPLAQRG